MVRRSNTGTLFEQEITSIRHDMANLRHDLAELLRSVIGRGRAAGDRTREQLHETADDVRSAFHSLRDRSEGTLTSVRDTVSKRPLTYTAIAFGAGILIGAMLRRD